jgi:RNA polymerase sigma factor (sigma-70 family)
MIDATTGWAGVLQDHRAELVRMAASRLRRGTDAEDVLHEVLLRVLRSGRRVDAVGAPVAYLRRAVANECVSAWRRSAHDVLVETMPDQHIDNLADACVDRLSVRRALTVLTERQRRVITLTVLDDRADHEVALMLGVTTVTVRTTRRRALARLRQELVDPPVPAAA